MGSEDREERGWPCQRLPRPTTSCLSPCPTFFPGVVRLVSDMEIPVPAPPRRRQRKRGRLVRGLPWRCSCQRQHISARRALLRQPWVHPLLAMNIAATQIQRIIRGVLVRTGKQPKLNRKKPPKRKASAQLRKYMASAAPQKKPLSPQGEEEGNVDAVIDAGTITTQSSSTSSTSSTRDARSNSSSNTACMGFSDWCATRISAWWRMLSFRYKFKLLRFRMYVLAAVQVQLTWREYRHHKYEEMGSSSMAHSQLSEKKEEAARVIGSAWRRHVNLKIFNYYKELVRFHMACDPSQLLKHVSPEESDLSYQDAAIGVHVRFRLGGTSFPPTLFYKVYTHSPLCDVNAFAPRDYVSEKAVTAEVRNNQLQYSTSSTKHGTLRVGRATFKAVVKDAQLVDTAVAAKWYRRYENNGWRPVSFKSPWKGAREMALAEEFKKPSPSRQQPFQFARLRRREELVLLRKERKRRWLKHMYKEGRLLEELGGTGQPQEECATMRMAVVVDGGDTQEQHSQWVTRELDYDTYVSWWQSLATSASSGRLSFSAEGSEDIEEVEEVEETKPTE